MSQILVVTSTSKKGKQIIKEFTEKQSAKALWFLCKEFAKGNVITKSIKEC